MKPANLLVVDDDFGFRVWVAMRLTEVGWAALPAVSIADAKRLIADEGVGIVVVILNASLQGAADFVVWLHERQDQVRVIALEGKDNQSPRFQAQAFIPRPTDQEIADSPSPWLLKLDSLILSQFTGDSSGLRLHAR
jgi:DNA-binding NtrC family response regulator